jgi:hypothetical protein
MSVVVEEKSEKIDFKNPQIEIEALPPKPYQGFLHTRNVHSRLGTSLYFPSQHKSVNKIWSDVTYTSITWLY